jgi:hypothetical protein
MDEKNENKELQVFNGHELAATAAAAMAKAEIESAYIMALKKPRSWDDVRAKILDACRRPVFAEKAEYKKPIGGSSITGPSVRFAETAIQAAGNIRTVATVLYDDESIRKVNVQVIDLENNISYGKEITLQKTVERKRVRDGQTVISQRLNSRGEMTYIVAATEDELAFKQGAQESKILRNCGLKLIPGDIIEEAMEVAKATRRKGIDPKAETNKVVDAFTAIGIKPSEIEKYLGKPIAQVVAADIDELRTIYTAIKDGDARWSDYLEDAEVIESGSKSADDRVKEAKAKQAANQVEKKPENAELPRNPFEKIESMIASLGLNLKPDVLKTVLANFVVKGDENKPISDMSEKSLMEIEKGLAGMLEAKRK